MRICFQYLNMLKAEGPLKWVQEENRDIGLMSFRFKDRESPRGYISGLVHNLQEYPMEDILSVHYIFTEWEPELIEQIWNEFVPDKVR